MKIKFRCKCGGKLVIEKSISGNLKTGETGEVKTRWVCLKCGSAL